MTAKSVPDSRTRTKWRATRRPAVKPAVFSDRILLHTRASQSTSTADHSPLWGVRGEEGNAQHFDEVEDEGERVRGHGQPAHRDARLRAPVEAPEPQLGVVNEEVVTRLLRGG